MQFELENFFNESAKLKYTSRDLERIKFGDQSIGAIRRGLLKLYRRNILDRSPNSNVQYGEFKYWLKEVKK